jgi:hypothetical protein
VGVALKFVTNEFDRAIALSSKALISITILSIPLRRRSTVASLSLLPKGHYQARDLDLKLLEIDRAVPAGLGNILSLGQNPA